MSDSKDEFKNNLVSFLKLFKNRPYHLAKFLIDNSAFCNNFEEKISNMNINQRNNFKDISEMNEFYDSILDIKKSEKTEEEALIELKDRLNLFIESERFEEAAILRDYINNYNKKR